ncbi:MAG: hypothetical protein Faunusvirus6_17 [Faunusvirus sp.]|jgi:hypothetical protein|uniref:Uncharacterized protein n=1 Tax=Faunusvirus sp. TaxID=2487766 RepID=A0A3G5A165_9VIRU|nr:MAG: hypothetical protein Faunusvirus6_17 [Faunusvirus sp.]
MDLEIDVGRNISKHARKTVSRRRETHRKRKLYVSAKNEKKLVIKHKKRDTARQQRLARIDKESNNPGLADLLAHDTRNYVPDIKIHSAHGITVTARRMRIYRRNQKLLRLGLPIRSYTRDWRQMEDEWDQLDFEMSMDMFD